MFYCFSKAESNNINSVQSRNQRLRPRPLIQSMISGFFKLMIFRIGTLALNIILLSAVRVQDGACFHHRFCAARRSRASTDLFLIVFNTVKLFGCIVNNTAR